MNVIIIDGYTGQIITASQLRRERYNDAMSEIISQSDHWITPDTHYRDGSPQGVENHGQTREGGAYAAAVEMEARGYAVGHHGA